MDSHTSLDRNNPINNLEESELCKHCQLDLVNEKGEMICEGCDVCVCCVETLTECKCDE